MGCTTGSRSFIATLAALAAAGAALLGGCTGGTSARRGDAPRAAHRRGAAEGASRFQPPAGRAATRGMSLAGIPVGRWISLRPAPTPRTEVAAATLGRAAYVIGGFTHDGRSSAIVERLELASGRWSPAPPLPAPRNHASAAADGGSLYVIGGYASTSDASTDATATTWRLTPGGTAGWTRLADAPLPRAAAGAAVIGQRIYVAGGRSDVHTAIDAVAAYDTGADRWSMLPPLHHAREHVAVAAAGGSIYVFGGRVLGEGDLAYVERLRPRASSWEDLAPMPRPRAGFAAIAVGGDILLVGGEAGGRTVGEVDVLDTQSGKWRTFPPLPTPRHGLAIAGSGPLVWAIAGGPEPGLTTSAVVERLRVRDYDAPA